MLNSTSLFTFILCAASTFWGFAVSFLMGAPPPHHALINLLACFLLGLGAAALSFVWRTALAPTAPLYFIKIWLHRLEAGRLWQQRIADMLGMCARCNAFWAGVASGLILFWAFAALSAGWAFWFTIITASISMTATSLIIKANSNAG